MDGVKLRTRSVYEKHAAAWDAQRGRTLSEKAWLDRMLARTSAGDTVLDVGCGAGEPIARYVMEQDRRICGIDFAEPMLAIARQRFPEARWILGDMRALDLGESFSGVIAWDSFFHLTPDDQRSVIPRLARHVAPGGGLLMTVGPSESEVTGTVEGDAIYHASLSIEEYEVCFRAAGLEVAEFAAEDRDCTGHSVLLAAKGPVLSQQSRPSPRRLDHQGRPLSLP